jgi:GcrA cell cycle regulator
MWADGATATQIARQLPADRTRSSVLGKVHRMKLATRERIAAPKLVARYEYGAPKAPTKPVEVVLEDPGPMDPPITTLDLRDGHCKWPYDAPDGAYHYCGAPPKAGRPWCHYHCRKAYQPPKIKAA